MALRIRANTESVYAQTRLARVERSARQTTRKLASGVRISAAADAAADLGISEKMRAHVRSAKAAARNIQDGISLINTADGGLDEVAEKIVRLRELAVQSASDVMTSTERGYLASEFSTTLRDIDRIAETTDFNGLDLLGAGVGFTSVQVGIHQSAIENRMKMVLPDATSTGLGIVATDVSTANRARISISRLDGALDLVNGQRAVFGAAHNQLRSAFGNLETWTENTVEAESRIRDADLAQETSDLTRAQVFRSATVSILTQANSEGSAALQLLG